MSIAWQHTLARHRTRVLTAVVVVLAAFIAVALWHATRDTTLFQPDAASTRTGRVYVIGKTAPTSVRFVPLGDSLTAGVGVSSYTDAYPYQLARLLHDKSGTQILLQPYAIPGATTADAEAQLLDTAVAAQPDLVTVLLGVNDAIAGVPAATFRTNYEHILDRLQHGTHARIYIITIPYIGASDHITPSDQAALRTRIEAFNAILRDLARARDLPLIDLYTPTAAPADETAYYSADHFHPSAAGYAQWASILNDHLSL